MVDKKGLQLHYAGSVRRGEGGKEGEGGVREGAKMREVSRAAARYSGAEDE
jgi:hypothetical protein